MTTALAAQVIPGFVCAFVFNDAGQPCPLTRLAPEASILPAEGWIWLHINIADRRCLRWLSGRFGIGLDLVESFAAAPRRVHVDRTGDVLAAHLGDFRQAFDDQQFTEHAWLHVLLAERFLITGRVQPAQSVDTLRKAAEQGRRFAAPGRLLEALAAHYPEVLDRALQRLMEELETIEDHILDDRHRGERRRLMLVRRESASLHRRLRAMRRGLRHAPRLLPEGFAAIAARLDYHDQDFGDLENRARFFHDEIDAKLAAETNRQLYILSALTAVFLPPTLVAGLFGMNFNWLPWTDTSSGFFIAASLCAFSSAAVWQFLRVMRKR